MTTYRENVGKPVLCLMVAMAEASPQTRLVLPCSDWDTRKHRHYVPISVRVLKEFLRAGFVLKEDIVKLQHKMMTTRQRWRGRATTSI